MNEHGGWAWPLDGADAAQAAAHACGRRWPARSEFRPCITALMQGQLPGLVESSTDVNMATATDGPPPISGNTYEAENVVVHRINRGRMEYLVNFTGYDSSQ